IDQVMNMPQGGAPVTAPVTSDPDAGRQMLGASASPIGGNSPAGALNRSNTGTVLPGYDIPNRIAADAMFDQDAVLRNAINNLKNEPPVSQVDVANALIEGKFKGANANEIRNQVAELTKMTNGDPRIAGLLMEMNDQGGQGLW
ncbi:hypothetical protein J8I31_14250, partial [Listeria innocua]|uniref:hypothetical protein n=1 Tax=Listeria innocua TaxID=1642 RepID=UPI001AE3CD8C